MNLSDRTIRRYVELNCRLSIATYQQHCIKVIKYTGVEYGLQDVPGLISHNENADAFETGCLSHVSAPKWVTLGNEKYCIIHYICTAKNPDCPEKIYTSWLQEYLDLYSSIQKPASHFAHLIGEGYHSKEPAFYAFGDIADMFLLKTPREYMIRNKNVFDAAAEFNRFMQDERFHIPDHEGSWHLPQLSYDVVDDEFVIKVKYKEITFTHERYRQLYLSAMALNEKSDEDHQMAVGIWV